MGTDESANAPGFEPEIEHGHAAYSEAELLEQCQLNAQAFIVAVFGAMEDPESLNTLVERVAATFASGWNVDRDWHPIEVLDALLVNYRSFGATIESHIDDDDAPSAVLVGLPNAELMDQLGVPVTSFRPMLAIAELLAARMQCKLEWSHDAPAGRIRLQVERAAQ